MRGLVLAGICVVASGVVPLPIHAGDAGAKECISGTNFVVSHSDSRHLKYPSGRSPGSSPARIEIDPKDKDLFRPMTRAEIKLLVETLGSAGRKGGKEAGIREAIGKRVSVKRMGVLTQDILVLLAKLHLEELVAGLRKSPKADPGALATGMETLKALDICGRGRYAGFGDDPAFRESLQIVVDNRRILEELILEPMIPGGKPPRGGGSPLDTR